MWALAFLILQTASSEPTDQVRRLVREATARYDIGDFARAHELYREAYNKDPRPALLYNIGQCQKHLGQHEAAIFSFKAYIRHEPTQKHKDMARQLIAESELALKNQRAAQPRKIAAATAPPVATAQQPVVQPEETPIHRTWWFWTIIGGSLAATAAVTTFAVVGAHNSALASNLPSGSLGTVDRR